MEKSNMELVDLQVPGDVGLKGIVGGMTLRVASDAGVVAPSMVKGVSLDTKQLEFLARSNLAGVVGVPC